MTCSLNVNGLTQEKFGDILWWMGEYQIDILCCQDTRVPQEELYMYSDQVTSRLGAQAKCFVEPGQAEEGKRCKVGGQMIIVSHLWGGKCSYHAPDPTKHGVIASITIDLEDATKLMVISTYWPVKAMEWDQRPGRLWNRLKHHIQLIGKHMTPLEYIQSEIELMATAHMGNGGKGGNSALLCGDMNASWFNKRASHVVKEWAEVGQWANTFTQFPQASGRVRTYWHNPVKPTSWIDQILWHTSSSFQCTGGGVMYGPFWITVSDHRPIYGCFTGPGLRRYSHMKHGPTKMPVQLKRIALSKFNDNKAKFKLAMTEMLHTIPGHTGALEAGDVLQIISRKTVEAVPGKPDKKLRRKTFKDCWSPYSIAGKTHLKAVVAIRRHLLGTKNTHRWRDALEAA